MGSLRLSLIVDQLLAPVPGGIGRYAAELARALLDARPEGAEVRGYVSRTDARGLREVRRRTGLEAVDVAALARRPLSAAWALGFAVEPPRGQVHAMSLVAPLRRSSPGPTVVTIHDAVPWTHPETLTRYGAAWHRAMGRRARRFADAVVTPTRAVADELDEILRLGDRLYVAGGAASSALRPPADADAARARLGLPQRYVAAVATLEPRKGLEHLFRAVALVPDLRLCLVGPAGWGGVTVAGAAARSGLSPDRITRLVNLSDEELAAVYVGARAVVVPSLEEGFGLPLLEAMSVGAPVIHSDAAALREVAGGAGVLVPLSPSAGYADRLADAIRGVIDDDALRAALGERGRLRSLDFRWSDTARRVWDLHARL